LTDAVRTTESATHLSSRLARKARSFLSSSVAASLSSSVAASATASSSSVRTGSQFLPILIRGLGLPAALKDLFLIIHIAQLITLRVFTNVTLPTLPANEGQVRPSMGIEPSQQREVLAEGGRNVG
jgi:hypothetical protein